jgi:hypothetical protein
MNEHAAGHSEDPKGTPAPEPGTCSVNSATYIMEKSYLKRSQRVVRYWNRPALFWNRPPNFIMGRFLKRPIYTVCSQVFLHNILNSSFLSLLKLRFCISTAKVRVSGLLWGRGPKSWVVKKHRKMRTFQHHTTCLICTPSCAYSCLCIFYTSVVKSCEADI